MRGFQFLLGAVLPAAALLAQQPTYSGSNVSGQMVLTRTVNLLQQAQVPHAASSGLAVAEAQPERMARLSALDMDSPLSLDPDGQLLGSHLLNRQLPGELRSQVLAAKLALTSMPGLTVSASFSGTGFNGRRTWSSASPTATPLSPASSRPRPAWPYPTAWCWRASIMPCRSIAPPAHRCCPRRFSSNQVFGLPPILNPVTNARGPFLTDMRVFYDQGISRWFILQRLRDIDTAGIL